MNDYHCDLIKISGGFCLAFNKKRVEIKLLKDAKHVGIIREIKHKNSYMHLILNGGWATQCKCTKIMKKWITQETKLWTRDTHSSANWADPGKLAHENTQRRAERRAERGAERNAGRGIKRGFGRQCRQRLGLVILSHR